MNPEFKIDIINFKSVDCLFRERVLSEAIPINKVGTDVLTLVNASDPENGETYVVNRNKLIQRIADERTKIKRTVGRVERALEKIDMLPVDAREFIERSLAADLAEVYTGFEKFLKGLP